MNLKQHDIILLTSKTYKYVYLIKVLYIDMHEDLWAEIMWTNTRHSLGKTWFASYEWFVHHGWNLCLASKSQISTIKLLYGNV